METARDPATSKWQPSQAAFDKFLACLHPDRNQAGAVYETLHQKLILYFQCRAVMAAEECADEVLNRVMRKLEAGEEIREPATYIFGIARLMRLEVARQQERRQEMPAEIPVAPPRYDEEAELTAQVTCLRQCLQKLTPENRELIATYYQEEKRAKINLRQELARRLGLDMNSLRVRACRIRDQLQGCVKKCVQGG
ncbi:MAG TPA: sigma-70 family RNA polymerase sigma factor [Blastocatellia bacterium]|nr:sigma-70 family RNA polymerase sigma factor [Blastocatellia bacterium]